MANQKPSSAKGGAKKDYNNSQQTLLSILGVLMEHASKDHPMSVREIHNKLKENGPSLNTLNRNLPASTELLDALNPTQTLHQVGQPGARHVYIHDGEVHVVLENPEGFTYWGGDMAAVFEVSPPISPRYSTISNLLKKHTQLPGSFASLPIQLKCVMASKNSRGKVTYIPYQDWEHNYEANNVEPPPNQPRYYYLESPLSRGEWRILSDMVKVYPYISSKQTNKFLSAIRRMAPGIRTDRADNRYAFKHEENKKFFSNIELLDSAISARRSVTIRYGNYVLEEKDGEWLPALRQRENKKDDYKVWRIDPYALMWSNGYYYLVGKNIGMMNLRVDRIIDVAVLQDTFELPADFDPCAYRDRSPVMYPGDPTHIKLRCKTDMVNVLLDFFGPQARFDKPQGDYTCVRLNVAKSGVKLFAMQYAGRVEVLEPPELRNEIKNDLRAALDQYET